MRRLRAGARHQRLAAPGRLPVPRARTRRRARARDERRAAEPLRRAARACSRRTRRAEHRARARPSKGIVGAAYNPNDGVRVPVAVPVGLRGRRAQARASQVRDVHARHRHRASRAAAYAASRRIAARIACDAVVIAAGAWSPAGGAARRRRRCPTCPTATRSARPSRSSRSSGPMVSVLGTGLYFSPVDARRDRRRHGRSARAARRPERMGSTLRVPRDATRARSCELMPRARRRQDPAAVGRAATTSRPTTTPMLGETPGVAGLCSQMCGFVGHGFMMAPAVARAHGGLDGRRRGRDLRPLQPPPLRRGRLIPGDFIIG